MIGVPLDLAMFIATTCLLALLIWKYKVVRTPYAALFVLHTKKKKNQHDYMSASLLFFRLPSIICWEIWESLTHTRLEWLI